jgi:triosephosphate isomerase (TIM)
MRRPILAANWKMHKGAADAVAFAKAFAPRVADATGVDVVIAPPFTALAALGPALAGTAIALAAQNAHPEEQGAFTGEISAAMLREAGCSYAIVGHSERRTLFGESSEFVARKAEALLRHGIRPIVCVGESLAEREAGRTGDVIDSQLRESLARVPADRAADLVIAYEPIWAIGTGRTATPEAAQEVHARVRERLRERFGAAGETVRIQYGGSVKPDNVSELMAQPDIDGALVGGASLEPESFARIVRFEAR